jgi:hypothetical protein
LIFIPRYRVDFLYIVFGGCLSVHHHLPAVSSFDDKNIKWFSELTTLYEAIKEGWR